MNILINVPLEIQQDLIKNSLYHDVDVSEAVIHYLVLGLESEKSQRLGPYRELDDITTDEGC